MGEDGGTSTDRPDAVSRDRAAGGWAPITLYAVIVGGWCVEAVSIDAGHLLPLVLWTVPVFGLYLRGMVKRRDGA